MSWNPAADRKRLAPFGTYDPERYRVTVHDTFQQYKLRMAATQIRSGMAVPEFLLFAAEYTIAHHRELRHFAAVFRKGAREIATAGAKPVNPNPHVSCPESERERNRYSALCHFCTWAGEKLIRRREEEPG
ncbi:MAG TPA: hypothetical protein VGS07_18405 [Thermoanaerobaculia bacterium]|jgi:hypothetical protein|nr:hypothetical protein [Thermoanaerobaculia bacterium]